MTSIEIQKLGKFGFTEQYKLGGENIPARAGIYAILGNNNRVLYVGQSGNFFVRLTNSHHEWNCWFSYCRYPTVCLFYSSLDEEGRKKIEQEVKLHFESFYGHKLPCGS